jgi:transposase
MSGLRRALADYLALRRALGHRLQRDAKLLDQFVGHLEGAGRERITIADALAWATLPDSASPDWRGRRLSAVRGFAAWLHSLDAGHEVPPAGLLPARTSRRPPTSTPMRPTEGLNLLVKKVKRAGHGFRSFANYRLRILLHADGVHCAPAHPPALRIRTRTPH